MKLWKYTPLDGVMLALSVAQFGLTLWVAAGWEGWSYAGRAGSFALLVFMMVYNIIILSHLFTHAAWFNSPLLNGLVSVLNSVNIGQSVQAYQLTHVRNHHRYNNDRKGPDGRTRDASSTFRDGVDGEHAGLFRYAFVGATSTLPNVGRALLSAATLWRVGGLEPELLALASKTPAKRARELRQIRLDRAAHLLALYLFLSVSWKWTLLCYLPAFYLALALVNLQNYYEHYGARPGNSFADSVSYYGRLYNLLAFNDGYHQEHHLRPQAHWRSMKFVRRQYGDEFGRVERVVSPVPAILGFFHRDRPLLHRRPAAAAAPPPLETLRDRDAAAAVAAGSLAHE
ncbi:MAG: fatty acid desaturase [Acidobacteria bacterium]|nr:fatty acid desaturase [Acidobacteriota bacterium]